MWTKKLRKNCYLKVCLSYTLREETLAEDIFAEFIFATLHQNFTIKYREFFMLGNNRKIKSGKGFLIGTSCKNKFRRFFLYEPIAKINPAKKSLFPIL